MRAEEKEIVWAMIAAGALQSVGARSDRAAIRADELLAELEKRSKKWRVEEDRVISERFKAASSQSPAPPPPQTDPGSGG